VDGVVVSKRLFSYAEIVFWSIIMWIGAVAVAIAAITWRHA
jgi:hypothetical protein